MKNRIHRCLLRGCASAALLLALGHAVPSAIAQTPSLINCQGRLFDGEKLLDGEVTMTLRIFSQAEGGELLYEDVNKVQVVDGIYSTFLGDNTTKGDLAQALGSGAAFLEVTAGDTTFMPRERLASVPFAKVADGVRKAGVTADMIGPKSVGGEALVPGAVGTDHIADGAVTPPKLSEAYWSTSGNVSEGGKITFVGTLDGRPLDMRVGNKRALRLEPAKISPNLVGGHEMNRSGDGVNGATVSGGGAPGTPNKAAADYATVGGGIGNTVLKERGTISGGRENTAAGIAAVIAGGYSNQVAQSYGTIGGGYGNENEGYVATVAGGWANQAGGKVATVGGGQNNRAQGAASTVAGGWQNTAAGNAATVAGGHSNTAEGNYASVGGGTNNVATGNFAAIPGGSNNAATGDNAFAGGEGARAVHPGAFVWSDSQADSLASTGADQFIIQAKGNVGIDTNTPDQKLTVAGNVKAEQFIGDGSKLTGVLTSDSAFAGDVIGSPGNLRVRPGAIGADHLAPGVIDESLKRSPIANQLAAISRDAVTKGTVVNGDVVGTLDGLRLKPGVVTADKLAPEVVEGMQIKPGSIGAESLDPALRKQLAGAGENALTGETLFTGDVVGTSTNLQLRAGVVSAEKLAPNLLERAINQSPLAADVARLKRQALDKNQVVGGEVVGTLADLKIGDGAVTPAKLSPEIRAGLQALEEGSVRMDSPIGGDVMGTPGEGLKVRRGAITADKLAPDVIEQALNTSLVSSQMSKLQREVVTRDFVANGEVVGTLDGLRVRPGTITTEKLSPQLLQELQSMGKPEQPKPIVFAGDLVGTAPNAKLRPGSVTVDKLSPEVIDAVGKYNDLSVELAKLAGSSLSNDVIFNGDVVGTADNLKLREGLIEQAIQQSDYARALAAKLDQMGQGDDRNLQILAAIESLKDAAMSNSTQFDGDLEGTAKQLRLKRNVVRTEHLAPGSVTQDKLSLIGSLNPSRAGVDALGSSEVRWKGLYVSDRIDYDTALTFTSGGVVKMVIDEQGDLSVDGLRLSGGAESPSVIGGHRANRVDAGAFGATIAGGGNVNQPNVVSSEYGSIAGGFGNHVTGFDSSIGGGQDNRAGGKASAIAGGFMNKADGLFPAVGGGAANIATANASVISGGFSNRVEGAYATIPGGYQNYATGDFSMAAGHRAMAGHVGSFVWSDASPGDFSSTGRNQFSVRASGGTAIYSNPQGSTGVKLPAGSGSWAMLSDRNAKENLSEVNSEDVLEHLAKLPIYTWNYRTQHPDVRHIGPVSQDFHALFGMGEEETHITAIDADGVALSAIKGLVHRLEAKDKELDALREENQALKARFEDVESKVNTFFELLENLPE